ncbi:MAG TPA: hypothetical protein VMF13_01735 [Luteitalea sp.]|nr:hypothetical protein [Luteitalea sp.]
MRITLDIDDATLRELRTIHLRESRSLDGLVSELLADALARRRHAAPRVAPTWVSRPMGALVDLSDKAAVREALSRT